jgi:DNA topoisomerase-1
VVGAHPDDGAPINVFSGRYGPYVSHAGINATLPRDLVPEEVTLDQAVALLRAQAERKGRNGAARPKAKAKAKPTPAANAEPEAKAERKAKAAAKAKPKTKGSRRAKAGAARKKPARTPRETVDAD